MNTYNQVVSLYSTGKSRLRKWLLFKLDAVDREACVRFSNNFLRGRITGQSLFSVERLSGESLTLEAPVLILGKYVCISDCMIDWKAARYAVVVAPWSDHISIRNCIIDGPEQKGQEGGHE